MALAFHRDQLGIEVTGSAASVPDAPTAKLMYYLHCICSVLDLTSSVPRELIDYVNHHRLDRRTTRCLMEICKHVAPNILEGKCIFETTELRGSGNEFIELSATRTAMVATSGVMMAGRNVQVTKVMLYKPAWRRANYDNPMAELSRSMRSGRSCAIM